MMNINVPGRFFKEEYLETLAEKNAVEYQTARPFSHIFFDDFLPSEALDEVLKEFPDIDNPQWHLFKSETDNDKFGSTKYELIPPYTRYVLDQLNTPPFLRFLEKLTGIEHLIPDPYYQGGGMHQTKRGGWLGIHVDFTRNEELRLYRRINVLLYLNKEYEDEYGGHLELWDEKMERCHKKIAPIFNRLAIFTTSENSHHGHPDKLNFPEGVTRKSLAWYYYTAENGANMKQELDTHFKARPGKDALYNRRRLKQFLRSLIPPVVFDIKRKIKG